MSLVEVSRNGSILLSPEYFAFAEVAVGTIGDQQAAMGLPQPPRKCVQLRKCTHCPFCDTGSYTVRLVWREGTVTAHGVCAARGTRCESRWLR